jgi:hypothetical protein
VATAGHPQIRAGKHLEAGIVTAGDDLPGVRQFMRADGADYTAVDVVERLLSGSTATV